MVRNRRNFVPGGTYFFTVTLADRRSSALVDHVSSLRMAFRVARSERPFQIDAIVVLPDHLHAMFTLPPSDADFSGRWRRNQGAFQQPNDFDGWPASSPPERRLCPVAKTFLGTHHPRRQRLCPSYRLHPFQPGEARFGVARARLALFVVPPIRSSRIAGRRLGGRLGCWRAGLRRTRRLTRMSLRSSGLRLSRTSHQHA